MGAQKLPQQLTIGVDVGGTNIRAGVVDSEGQIVEVMRCPTPHSVTALDSAVVDIVDQLRSRNPIVAVGVAAAGFVDKHRQMVSFAPHLPWINYPVRAVLQDRLDLPVVLEHDVNAAAWAEHRYGAATGHGVVVTVAIGTGIGCALLIDGVIFRGGNGVAPELGHVQVVADGRACGCGKRGCWERYCSGTAMVDTAIERLSERSARQSVLFRAWRQNPGSLTGRRIASAAREGDPVAAAVLDDFAKWLGLGLAWVSDIFDPDLIVLAGGVGSSSAQYLDVAVGHLSSALTGGKNRQPPRVRTTLLGEAASMIGAATLARDTIDQNLAARQPTG